MVLGVSSCFHSNFSIQFFSKSWRSVGIYWVSGIVNSMIVLLFGVASGRHSPTFCTFLNVPYAVIPVIVGIR